MNRSTTLLLRLFGLALTIGLIGSACTVGSKLRAKHTEIAQLNSDIDRRAYRCAPKELALSKSHAEFGLYELQMGDWPSADDHLVVAYENANLADINSRGPECRDIAMIGDRDGDTILDNVDACPDDPEDFDNYEDTDGCPEDQDTDGDGLTDSKDMCPTEPGPPENQGCPQKSQDKDSDGILDAVDKCPLDPEDFDGFEDEDGCPDNDNDQDKILDPVDKCPNEPEDYDNYEDEDGCPEPGTSRVVLSLDRIEIKDSIYFKSLSPIILEKSYPLLNEITDIIIKTPRLQKIEIQGHTDVTRTHAYCDRLSDQRASAVREYLVGRGVEPSRLVSKGYGKRNPISTKRRRGGNPENRRVEFHILQQETQKVIEGGQTQ